VVLEDVLLASGSRLLNDFELIPQSACCDATTVQTRAAQATPARLAAGCACRIAARVVFTGAVRIRLGAGVMRKTAEGLMPSLEDNDQVYLLLPTSAKLAAADHVLSLPNPDARSPDASDYMTKDVWFEDCGDGGVYIIGIGGDVIILYVDGPGNSILCRYKCTRKRWKDLWVATFGAVELREPVSVAPKAKPTGKRRK
jgi:hypothetical protein